jgi:dihydropteroate synthase
MRILDIATCAQAKKIMEDIGVDRYGIKIMLPKAMRRLVKVDSLPAVTANILKQEMLSIGGDVAVAKGALTGKQTNTDCLIMGSVSQFTLLQKKLTRQKTFGLNNLAVELGNALSNYLKDKYRLNLKNGSLRLYTRTHLMGIINLTPDSFSGDGLCGIGEKSINRLTVSDISQRALDKAQRISEEGADIIDIGGESSRPGAHPVSLKEELRRVIPAIRLIAKKVKLPLSIDTYKPEVARQALDNGVSILNDISGLRNRLMPKIVARYKAAVVIMHMRNTPKNMQEDIAYGSFPDDIISYLSQAIKRAVDNGIAEDKIIVDPGIGFGKTLEQNLQILNRLGEFKILGKPILLGLSRKRFIGKILNAPVSGRIFGTISACVIAAKGGAHILRVHDVKETKQALKIFDRIKRG